MNNYKIIKKSLIISIITQIILSSFTIINASNKESYQDYVNILYNSENGLPTSEANDVVQSSDGFIWIASYSGLIRYDGDTFKRYTDSNEVASANVLYIDSNDVLWIGTNDNGIVKYQDGKYETYNTNNGLASNSVKAIVEDSKGNLYVGTTEGISYLNIKKKSVSTFSLGNNDTYIDSLTIIHDSTVIYTTNTGNVYYLENKKAKELKIPNINENFVSVDFDDNGWILNTDNNIIFRCTGTINNFTYNSYVCGTLENINKAKYTSNGNLWICSDTGVGYFDKEMKFNQLSDYQINNSVDNMIEDFEGNLWFSSSRQGIFKCTINYFSNMSKNAGLSDHVVNSIVKYQDNIYVATDSGLVVFDSNNQLIENDLTDYLDKVRIRCLMVDSKNNLWACTYGNKGLVSFDGSNIKSISSNEGITSAKVRSVVEDSEGNIIVASGDGIYYVNNNEVIKHIGNEDGLINPEILSLCFDKSGLLYAGSDGGGIYIIKGKKVIDTINENNGLRSGIVMRIRYDSDEDGLWLITSNSIAFYKDKKAINIDKFPYSNNYDLYFGSGNTLWILSSNGLYIVQKESMLNKETLRYTFYNYNNGMPSTPTANSFSYMDEDNKIFYFCGSSGIYSMTTNELSDENNTRLTIPDIVVDGQVIRSKDDSFEIPADSKRVKIEAYALSYGLQNPLISYYLEGFEEEKTVVRKADLSDISYTNLKGGNYTFHFSIIDPNSNKVIDTKVLKIHKNYTLMEQPWFYPIVLFLIGGTIFLSVYIILRFRMNRVLLKNKEEQQEKLEKALDVANIASAAKGTFLSNMSHDIRTPMNAIIGMTNLAINETDIDVIKDYLSNIDSSSNFLLGLINDILDMSKIESGEFTLHLEKYNKKDFELSINTIIKPLMEKKNINFVFELNDHVNCMVVDKLRINQIFFNLLSNASKFTPNGGKVEFLSSSLPSINGLSGIRFIVRDNGIGMSKEFQKDMFTPFIQENKSQDSSIIGTGLGLPIVKSIIDAMNGTIKVNSDINQGCEYIIDLYVKETKEQKRNVIKNINLDFTNLNILLVEDNQMNVLVAKKLLENKGINVIVANNGQVAIDCFKESPINYYDAILMDVRMPIKNGIEATKEIRQLPRQDALTIKIIALTADAFVEEQKKTFEAGMNAHLTKPIEPDKLFETLAQQINKEK